MSRLFGTDGVRGVANKELTAELAYDLGRSVAYVLNSENKRKTKIVVGKDTRISGDMLEAALVAGICSVGADVIKLGVVPTPAIAHLTKKYKFDAGIVISASHNSYEFNGIKVFNENGYKLSDDIENRIEDIILDKTEEVPHVIGQELGRITTKETADSEYIDFLNLCINNKFDGMKIAIDCANGAAYKIAPKILLDLGASVIVINDKPDGVNINNNCGSTHMEGLKKLVLDSKADMGLAFDGDADRVLAVDEKGQLVDGDQIMAIIGNDLKKKGKLANNTIVATVMSNLGLDIMGKNNGIEIVKTSVGDRCVLEEMLDKGHILGGEQSGHVIFTEYNTTGDGILTGLQLLNVLNESKKPLSELSKIMDIFPQVIRNARVDNSKKNEYLNDGYICKKCKEVEEEFKGEGRVLIRPSGTEPVIRVMIEGKDNDYITSRAEELVKIIEERLN